MTSGRDGTVQEAGGNRNTRSTDLWLERSRTRRWSADLWKLFAYGQEQVQEHAGQQLTPPKELAWVLGRTGSHPVKWNSCRDLLNTSHPHQRNWYGCWRELGPSRPGSRNRWRRWLRWKNSLRNKQRQGPKSSEGAPEGRQS